MKRVIFLFVLLTACQVNEADFPEVATHDAQQIGATSVVMEAAITEIGPIRPMNYGFLWDAQENITIVDATNKIILGSTEGPKTFSIRLDNLKPSTTYYYRGFAANGDFSKIYYSNIVSFVTLP